MYPGMYVCVLGVRCVGLRCTCNHAMRGGGGVWRAELMEDMALPMYSTGQAGGAEIVWLMMSLGWS